MPPSFRQIISISALAFSALALVACDREGSEGEGTRQTIGIDQVPAPVKATILAQSSGATVQSIEKVDRGGQAVYEAHLNANGKNSELRVGDDGKVLPAESKRDDDD